MVEKCERVHHGTELNTDRLLMTQAQTLSMLTEFRTVMSYECVYHGTELNTDRLVDQAQVLRVLMEFSVVKRCECVPLGNRAKY